MKTWAHALICAVVTIAVLGIIRPGEVAAQSALTISSGKSRIHILPMPRDKNTMASLAADSGPLVYHSGGSIMSTTVVYAILWVPSTLQTGVATGVTGKYPSTQVLALADYMGHGLGSNNTQYYQTTSSTTYVQNKGGLGGFYVDTNPYPASGCTDTATPGACVTDAQVQTEISNVMSTNGWTPGINKIFMLFTSYGEGSCFGSSCSYTSFCAYHSYFGSTSSPVIYANIPYGVPALCQVSGTPAPSGDATADTAASAASHELTESITDPLLNAWYTAQGNEIGDLCAYNYGTNRWDSGNANQMWNGDFYELQMEFDNLTGTCVQSGP